MERPEHGAEEHTRRRLLCLTASVVILLAGLAAISWPIAARLQDVSSVTYTGIIAVLDSVWDIDPVT